jgi:hypothetical protein
MAKSKKSDVFYIEQDEVGDIKKEIATVSSGILCPKTNKSIGERCHVCEYIQTQVYSKNYERGHDARDWAASKKAKLAWFLNVVFPENPDKSVLLEVGKEAGNQIINGVEKLGWRDIAHPHKDLGRELQCSKNKEKGNDWPTYTVTPVLEKANWEIPDEVWKKTPDLKNIVQMVSDGELNEDNHMRISSLKMGETLVFRVCPPKTVENGSKWIIAPVMRHWGVTEGQIQGTDSVSWKETMEDEDIASLPVKDEKLDLSFTSTEEEKEEVPDKKQKKEKPTCFGMERFFDEDDDEMCIPCDFYKSCGKKVASA